VDTAGRGATPKNLVLILARELASNVATPIFIVDAEGTLVFYNEPADAIIGRPFSQVGEMSGAEWGAMLRPENLAGEKVSRMSVPPAIALFEQRPAHQKMQITGFDGQKRRLAITAFPLFAKVDEFVGAISIFWEENDGTAST
jgi:PAS domain-containing protein